jgi:hypothetical protein
VGWQTSVNTGLPVTTLAGAKFEVLAVFTINHGEGAACSTCVRSEQVQRGARVRKVEHLWRLRCRQTVREQPYMDQIPA